MSFWFENEFVSFSFIADHIIKETKMLSFKIFFQLSIDFHACKQLYFIHMISLNTIYKIMSSDRFWVYGCPQLKSLLCPRLYFEIEILIRNEAMGEVLLV